MNTTNPLWFKVADIVVHVYSSQSHVQFEVAEPISRFLVDETVPECSIEVTYGSIPRVDLGKKVFDSGGNWTLHQNGDKYALVLVSPATGPDPYRLAIFDRDFRKGSLYIRPYRTNMPSAERAIIEGVVVSPFEYPLDELVVVNLLARGRGVNVHGCSVVNDGAGLLFCGSSGAGKSTLANLWKKRNVQVLSDDRLILRKQDGAFYVHGTPWHGDARSSLPLRAPLKAVYFIVHAPENRLVPLKPSDTITRLLVRSFPTFYSQEGMDYTVRLISEIALQVPCFEMGFKPDQSAIDYVLDHVPAFA
ncbi:MAG: hypothetical protein HYX90_09525 [Chloroflexi bacterium]|nr:hypothetical protein [Chloroflexota bacterium]